MNIEIKKLFVKTEDKEILKDFNLKINPGEVHAIMGPNGVGKSTLSKVLMGYPDYYIEKGEIIVDNKKINDLAIDERSHLGMFLVYQNPINIEGVTTSELIKASLDNGGRHKGLYEYILELEKNTEELDFDKDMLHRSFNVGFSGGERKKNEILQVLMLKPKFIILDELDSGLDVDSLKIVAEKLNQYLEENPSTSVLIITHYTRILDYIKPEFVHMMKNGTISQSGDFKLAKLIEKNGYKETFELEGNETHE
ncbi:MAG: Fe-S cluster assembly ATPase SufC [Bacilli bacterium]|nr:Fe-S cluster assembly ATPase SufC [Bacilli bacterium]